MIALALSLMFTAQASSLPLPTDAATPTPARSDQAAPATAREERRAGRPLVCRTENITGSRFPVRRCRPANLTPEEQALAADQLRRQQRVAFTVE